MYRRKTKLTARWSFSLVVLFCAALALVSVGFWLIPTSLLAASKSANLKWWSHWAEEENKKAVIQQVIQDYQKANPGVRIEITWWQKAEMFPAMRNGFTAGSGFPDLFYTDVLPEFFEAGWLEDLGPSLSWSNMLPAGREFWTRSGPAGKQGTWAMPLEASTELWLYNPKIFETAGVMVPSTSQFTADEFYEAARKIRSAGYDVFSQGIGDRPYPGQIFYRYMLTSLLGVSGYDDLFNGKVSWNSPDIKAVLDYSQKVMKIPAMPKAFTTIKLAEAHRYFHTEQKGATFLVGAWYTGRAFVPPEKGGQPKDFRLGFLRYPSWPGGRGNREMQSGFGGGLAVAAKSPNKDVAIDVVNFFAQEKYGNLWLTKTAVPTGIITNAATMPPTDFGWYFAAYERAYKDVDWKITKQSPCGALSDAYTSVLNEGLPQLLISVEDSIKRLEDARRKCM